MRVVVVSGAVGLVLNKFDISPNTGLPHTIIEDTAVRSASPVASCCPPDPAWEIMSRNAVPSVPPRMILPPSVIGDVIFAVAEPDFTTVISLPTSANMTDQAMSPAMVMPAFVFEIFTVPPPPPARTGEEEVASDWPAS